MTSGPEEVSGNGPARRARGIEPRLQGAGARVLLVVSERLAHPAAGDVVRLVAVRGQRPLVGGVGPRVRRMLHDCPRLS